MWTRAKDIAIKQAVSTAAAARTSTTPTVDDATLRDQLELLREENTALKEALEEVRMPVLLIAASVPSSHQTDLSAIYSGAETMILSCPDVQLIRINDRSSLTVCLNLLIYELAFTCMYVLPVVICLHIGCVCYVQYKSYLLTYLLNILTSAEEVMLLLVVFILAVSRITQKVVNDI